jgi:hypothetical protein
LREDAGLSEMIGHGIPSPEVARKFLYQFHAEEKIEAAKQRRREDEIAYIPEETEALVGLGLVNRALVEELGRRCPEQRIATVDQDATIIESRKQEALRTYEGERGYQPMLALWAELNVVLLLHFIEQHGVDLVVEDGFDLAFAVAGHQVRGRLGHFFRYEAILFRRFGTVRLVAEADGAERHDRVGGVAHFADTGLHPARGRGGP